APEPGSTGVRVDVGGHVTLVDAADRGTLLLQVDSKCGCGGYTYYFQVAWASAVPASSTLSVRTRQSLMFGPGWGDWSHPVSTTPIQRDFTPEENGEKLLLEFTLSRGPGMPGPQLRGVCVQWDCTGLC